MELVLHTGYKIAIWNQKISKQQKMIKNDQEDLFSQIAGVKKYNG